MKSFKTTFQPEINQYEINDESLTREYLKKKLDNFLYASSNQNKDLFFFLLSTNFYLFKLN